MSEKSNNTIKKLDTKIAQLKAHKKAVENKEKQRLKKERISKLIQFGELVERYLDCKTADELAEILKKLGGE